MKLLPGALLAALLAPALTAQLEDGAIELDHFTRAGAVSYSDVWGYRHASGREIAILGVYNGTSFVETTNPANLVELRFISRASSLWGDMEVLGDHCFVGTEGGGGLQIIDLSNPDNIQLVTTYTGSFSSTHNVRIDQGTKRLYAPGANTGMPVLDLTNPTSPVQVANYSSIYVHDCAVQNGFGYLAQIFDGDLRIVDVTSGSFPTLDVVQTSGNFTHNAWPDPTDSIVLTTDESSGGHLDIYDISNKSNIVKLGEFVSNPSAIIHNAFYLDGKAHCSYYTEGYVCVDVSDPTRPTKIAQFDQYSGPDDQYDGSWGCYPYQPSGVIYMSDLGQGLYTLTLAAQIDHDPLLDTGDTVGPYPVTAVITPAVTAGGAGATLHYSIDDAKTFTSTVMTPTGNPDEYSAQIPGAGRGAVHYDIEASDSLSSNRSPRGEHTYHVFATGARTQIVFFDFEGASDQGWTHQLVTNQDDWQRGAPQGLAGDPTYAFSGTSCWGNDLGQSGFNGAYQNNTENFLRSPAFDLSGVLGVRMRLKRWVTAEDSQFDQTTIEVNGTEVWRNPTNGGSDDLEDEAWNTIDLDLSALADNNPSVEVTFRLKTNGSTSFGGWNIDDFELYSQSTCPWSLYGQGTAGSGGFIPDPKLAGGDPILGNSNLRMDCDQLLGGMQTVTFIGFAKASVPVKGIELLVDLNGPFFFFFQKASGLGGGNGTITVPMPIPNDQAAVGVEVDLQVIQVDPNGPQGLSASPGLTFDICQ